MKNKVNLIGKVTCVFYSHTYNNHKFYTLCVDCERNTVIVKYKCLRDCNLLDLLGKTIHITGTIRSHSDGKLTSMYVLSDLIETSSNSVNHATVEGNVCSVRPMRYTKTGTPFITFVLATNFVIDGHKVNTYIPCVSYNNTDIDVGKHITVDGYIKSSLHTNKNNEKKVENELVAQQIYS